MKYRVLLAPCIGCLLLAAGCKKFVQVDTPIMNVSDKNVYSSAATAASVLTSMYLNLEQGNQLIQDGVGMVYWFAGLSADELTYYTNNTFNDDLSYFRNDIQPTTRNYLYNFSYEQLFTANAAIEGISASTSLPEQVKQQLIGEAKFMRAFLHFYLVNFCGDVPMMTTTDFTVNSVMPRKPVADIYQQMISDLKDAAEGMSASYLDGYVTNTTPDRVRPNKWTAKALLARVYLYTQQWDKAAATATEVIGAHDLYDMPGVQLDEVFLKSSRETIWALPSTYNGSMSNTGEGFKFVLPAAGPNSEQPAYLSNFILQDFEAGDQRKSHWVGYAAGYPYPNKYKAGRNVAAPVEHMILFRLAEQYLIRAEALIRQQQIADGIADLNAIRLRATDLSAPAGSQLPALATNLSPEAAIGAVMHEREIELFTEVGHRWLDLKRTDSLNARMAIVTPTKGGLQWRPYQALYPIPPDQLQKNPGLRGHQNPGYTN